MSRPATCEKCPRRPRPTSRAIRCRWRAWSRRSTGRAGTVPGFGLVGSPPLQSVRGYSEGAYLAYACNDYPALWDVEASCAKREQQYKAAIAALSPGTFAPWTNAEWADSEFFVYDYCLHWPAPRVAAAAVPGGRSLSDGADARA